MKISLIVIFSFIYLLDFFPSKAHPTFIEVPEDFPGHKAKLIKGRMTIPDSFDPHHYAQEREKQEGVCNFNSLVAGIMHTSYGRTRIQQIIQSQDEAHIYFRFYFPPAEIMQRYTLNFQDLMASVADDEEEDEINLLWNETINLSKTDIRVPKKFRYREDKGSFPQGNPGWLNLIQQAYMRVTKNPLICPYTSFCGYLPNLNFTEPERFYSLTPCKITQAQDTHSPSDHINFLEEPKIKSLIFLPLIDVPLKKLRIVSHDQTGLSLSMKDCQTKIIDEKSPKFSYADYNSINEFIRYHGMSKTLFTSNVMQFIPSIGTSNHAVALFFDGGKVYYYDNVISVDNEKVYGRLGPIYEEAKNFEGQFVEEMSEEDFFRRVFLEIDYRKKQVAEVRGQEAAPSVEIIYFEHALESQ